MKIAIQEAKKGMLNGDGGPFGAVIVKNGKVIGKGHNKVLSKNDATCHGEMEAIRSASRKLKNFDLSGCKLYTTAEPLPYVFVCLFMGKYRKDLLWLFCTRHRKNWVP